jgi:hypothetical protein
MNAFVSALLSVPLTNVVSDALTAQTPDLEQYNGTVLEFLEKIHFQELLQSRILTDVGIMMFITLAVLIAFLIFAVLTYILNRFLGD